MQHEEFSWKAADSQMTYAQLWAPDVAPKAVVCLVHGMGEHSGRYAHLAEFLSGNQVALLAHDHRGHGKSDGKRGHCSSYQMLLGSVGDLLGKAEALYPGTPIFLYGHSMGGNVVLNYLIRKNPSVRAGIATGPWLKLAFDPPKIEVFMGQLVGKILPSFTQSTKLDASAISRIPEEVKKYTSDPMVHDRISIVMFLGCFEAGLWALENAARLEKPVLLMHGTEDKLTSEPASAEFAQRAGANVKYVPWQGCYHEIHNEPERPQVFQTILDWINQHL